MKTFVIALLVAVAFAGCTDSPEGYTAVEAVDKANGVAESTIEDPQFLFAVTAQGPGAVEFFEAREDLGVQEAPFVFQMDVTGDLSTGRANSWIVMYESQTNGEVLMVHVGDNTGSHKLDAMDDHGHTHLMDVELEEAACPTAPEFQSDSTDFTEVIEVNPTLQTYLNETQPDTWSYFLFAEGSCFDAEIAHMLGFLPEDGLEAFAVMQDGASTHTFFTETPAPVTLIDQEDTFDAPVDQPLSSPENKVSFNVPNNGTASVFAAWTDATGLLPETMHVYLESPTGERHDFATFDSPVSGKQAYVDLTAGQWSVVYHSTTLQPLSSYTVATSVTI